MKVILDGIEAIIPDEPEALLRYLSRLGRIVILHPGNYKPPFWGISTPKPNPDYFTIFTMNDYD